MIYCAEAPANIALIKYWGKSDSKKQWPANSSLSMTLNELKTITKAQVITATDHEVQINGIAYSRRDPRGRKAYDFLDYLASDLNKQTKVKITSTNTFPMGCGIASSASSMAALCIAALAAWHEKDSFAGLEEVGFSRERLAYLARMGSGSACRSLFGGYVRWDRGKTHSEQSVHCLYNPNHWPLCDLVLVLNAEEKKVSSTAGHSDAFTSPLFRIRQSGLNERLAALELALSRKDMAALGPILEAEALEMHAVMLTGQNPILYLNEQSIQAIEWLREKRRALKLPVFFTIDAGPNLHLICEQHVVREVKDLLHKDFPKLNFLLDSVGRGPSLYRI